MKIIPTVCPQCNAQIKIDADKKTGVCEYCGMHFVLEDDNATTENSNGRGQKKKNSKSKLPILLFGTIAVLSLGILCLNHKETVKKSDVVGKTEDMETETNLAELATSDAQAETVTENRTSESTESKTVNSEYALADAVSAPGAILGDPVADLEITKAGYSVKNGYLYYALVLHNNSDTNAVTLPGFRYTAKSADGSILGTDEQYLFSIYPGQDCVWASQGFSISTMPETVEFNLIPPDEYNIMSANLMEQPKFEPYEIKNISKKMDSVLGDTIIGEVYNPNDYMVDEVAVSVVFLNEDGVIQGGDTTFIDGVTAKGNIPFSLNPICPETENYQVFACSWSM